MLEKSPRRRIHIALLFDSLISEYAVQLRRAIETAAARRDVRVIVVMGQRLGAREAAEAVQNRLYGAVSKDCVDGVIIVASTVGHYCGPEGLSALCRSYAPLPMCSVGVSLPGVPSLVIDNAGGMRLGTGHLMDVHHCRRIAFIAGQPSSVESNLRVEGYRQAHLERGIAVDEQLLVHGTFTVPSGNAKMRELLRAGVAFDAVVAANDSMALGALDALEEAGLQVPRDVMVCGFDDIDSAHFARPTLSTLRQPMWWLGEKAVDCVLDQLVGRSVAALEAGPVEFVRRESCGCGYQVALTVHPSGEERGSMSDVISERRGGLVAVMRGSVSIPTDALGDWPGMLLDALRDELAGAEGHFTAAFESLLERAQREGASLDEFQRLVSVMRSEFRRVRVRNRDESRHIERIWHSARVLVGASSIRLLGRQKIEQQQVTSWLSWVGERLATALSLSLLRDALIEGLPRLQIERGCVSLYTDAGARELKPLALRTDTGEVTALGDPFPETQLAPADFLDTERCEHFVVLPITFEAEMLGVAVLASGAMPSVYETLRQQIGSAVKGAAMHREMVEQVALRQRLEADRVSKEARLAAEIQTSMKPVLMDVDGLELAALMIPAAEAGGDYYDVIPVRDGAWLAIGDVTGHGLASGLVMLMIQSMVASLSRVEPPLAPSEVVSTIGDAIWDNVRQRLRRDDHATLTVLRYQRGGRFIFAGAHEDIIVWRQRQQRCDTIATPGFWVGAIPSIRRMTHDSEFTLEPGDVMVLYSDGVTEPRNAHHEQFSLERLVALVRAHASKSAPLLRDAIYEAVSAWSPSLDDDVTLLVVRYTGS